MITLNKSKFLQEPDASYLNIKDTTDYNQQYPSFTLEAFSLGVRMIVKIHVSSGTRVIYGSVSGIQSLSVGMQADYVFTPELAITEANNKSFVFPIPIDSSKLGEYDITLISIPLIDTPGNFVNTNYKDLEYGVYYTGVYYEIYQANKDYPKKDNPNSNGDFDYISLTDFDDLSLYSVTERVRVESALMLNYYDIGLRVNALCSSSSITVKDNSTYDTNSSSPFGVNNFNYFTYVKVTSPDETEVIYSSLGIGTAIPSNSSSLVDITISDIVTGIYKVEYINIPTLVVGATYRTGDVVYSPFYNKIYSCNEDITVTSYSQMLNSFDEITSYEDISSQFRQTTIIPVICKEMECFQDNFFTSICTSCGSCKFCKCKDGRNLSSATLIQYYLFIKDENFKETEEFEDIFNKCVALLKQLCDCNGK